MNNKSYRKKKMHMKKFQLDKAGAITESNQSMKNPPLYHSFKHNAMSGGIQKIKPNSKFLDQKSNNDSKIIHVFWL